MLFDSDEIKRLQVVCDVALSNHITELLSSYSVNDDYVSYLCQVQHKVMKSWYLGV